MITKEAIEAARKAILEHDYSPYTQDGLSAILTAAFAAMPVPAVRVKPLEWRLEDERDADFPRWNAEWNGIVFSVFKAWWGSKSKCGFVGGGDFHHTEEAAKAAAQADYEARILSALTPTPDLQAENDRLRASLEFVTLWAWREDPPNANRKLTDEERLSAIKYHPSIRAALEDRT